LVCIREGERESKRERERERERVKLFRWIKMQRKIPREQSVTIKSSRTVFLENVSTYNYIWLIFQQKSCDKVQLIIFSLIASKGERLTEFFTFFYFEVCIKKSIGISLSIARLKCRVSSKSRGIFLCLSIEVHLGLGIRIKGGSRYRYNYRGSRYPYRGLGIGTRVKCGFKKIKWRVLKVWICRAQKPMQNPSNKLRSWEKDILLFLSIFCTDQSYMLSESQRRSLGNGTSTDTETPVYCNCENLLM